MEQSKTDLTDELRDLKINLDQTLDKKFKQLVDAHVKDVERSNITQTSKNVGDTAPNFVLKNALGNSIELYEVLKTSPVILTWYRGGWCPYCNLQLKFLQNYLPKFKEAGGTLVALSPETPDNSLTTAEKHDLQFEVLTDNSNDVARAYGIVYKVKDELTQYQGTGQLLEEFNGVDTNELPLAATYIIDKNGVIRYAFLDADHTKRAEPNEILKALDSLHTNSFVISLT